MHIKATLIAAFALAFLAVPCVSLAQTTSVVQLQAEIQTLTAQLQSLKAQVSTAGGSTQWCHTFYDNLSIGMSGAAVTALQTALQKDGESIQITGTFDDQTASAVVAFQEKYQAAILAPYSLSRGTGFAGKSTRAELNSLFGCPGSISIISPITTNPTISTSTLPIPICPALGCDGPYSNTPPISTASSASTILSFSISNSSSSNIVLSGVPGTEYGTFIQVNNSGDATATVTGSTSENWISLGPIGGGTFSLAPGQHTIMVADVNVSSLAAGVTLSGTITVAGNFPAITIPVSFTNNASDYEVPTVSQVQGLTATASGNAVTLNWQAATANDGGTVVYDIYRTFLTSTCTVESGYVGQVRGLSYTDSPLPAGTYYYCLRSQDETENSVGPLSAQVSAAVFGSTTPSTSSPSLTVQLDPTTPAGAQVQTGAQNAALLIFDITNPSADPIKITQLGVSESVMATSSSPTATDFDDLTLSDLTSGQGAPVAQFGTLSRSTNVADAPWFSSAYPSNLIIPANATVKFLISGDISQFAQNPSEAGTQGAIGVGGLAQIEALDESTNLTISVSGEAYGNPITVSQGQ